MHSRAVAVVALAVVFLLTAIDLVAARSFDDERRFVYTGVVRIALFLLVTIAAGLAARRFGWWAEHLGRAWTLFCAAYALLTASEVVKRFWRGQPLAEETMLIFANLALVGAYWLMARSFEVAGIRYYGSTLSKVLFIGVTAAIAIALVSGSIVTGVQSLRTANPHPGQLLSAAADLITFLLAAPLLLTAVSLRGGHLFWTFALLTAGTFGWMFNQGAARVAAALGMEGAAAPARNFGFALACCLIAAAALVQWLEARRGARTTVAHA